MADRNILEDLCYRTEQARTHYISVRSGIICADNISVIVHALVQIIALKSAGNLSYSRIFARLSSEGTLDYLQPFIEDVFPTIVSVVHVLPETQEYIPLVENAGATLEDYYGLESGSLRDTKRSQSGYAAACMAFVKAVDGVRDEIAKQKGSGDAP